MGQLRVASAATDTQLLAPDGDRDYVIIENSDANRLHVRYGSSAAATDNYSFSLAQNANAIVPAQFARGEIRGIWAADGSGYAQITHNGDGGD